MRRRILLLAVGLTTLVVLAFAVPLALLIRHTVYQDAVRSLDQRANEIARYVGEQPSRPALDKYLNELPSAYRARVVSPDGTAVGREIPGDIGSVEDAAEHEDGDTGHPGPTPTQSRTWHGGQLIRLPVFDPTSRPGQPPALVLLWESDHDLRSGENGWFALLAAVALGLLLVGVVAGEVLTRRIVRPLVDTAATAERLSTGDTTARAPTDGPGEVAGVGRALNRLADRIDELIAEERETVADLSHRLRTPLTALRLDAEALGDPVEAERMSTHATTLERMLTAVIRAARRPQREGRFASCDATAVVGERVEFWSALTDDQERPRTIELPTEPLLVRCAAEDLAAAVNALLENVVAHTPEGTAFGVRLLRRDGGGARLEVCDEGPGIPSDEPVRGRSDRGSTGLGLDIARRCAEASGGTMTIGAGPSGGAVVALELGPP